MSIKDNPFLKRVKVLSNRTYEQLTSDKPSNIFLTDSETFTALQQDGVVATDTDNLRGKMQNECEAHSTPVKPTAYDTTI